MWYKYFGFVLIMINPYIYGSLISIMYNQRGYMSIGGEAFVPVAILILALWFMGVFDKPAERRKPHEE